MVGDGPLGDKLVGVKGCMAFNLSSMDRIRVVVGALMKFLEMIVAARQLFRFSPPFSLPCQLNSIIGRTGFSSFGTARYHSQLQHDNVHTRTDS